MTDIPDDDKKFEIDAEADIKTTADILKHLPEPQRNEHWMKGALKRGFYSAVQAFHAANLSVIMLAPKTARSFGLSYFSGGEDRLIEKISNLEKKIESFDIEPVEPSYLKSGVSFLLFNTTYLLPVLSVGMAAVLLTGPFAAKLIAGVAVAHAQMGETMVHTARKHADGESIGHKEVLDEHMKDPKFRRVARTNAFITGCVFMGVTLSAGHLARLLGGFTSGALASLARTPIGGYLTDKMVNAAHNNVVKSIRKPLAKAFTKVANDGPPFVAAKMAATLAFAKATTSAIMNRYIYGNENTIGQPEAAAEQDNEPPAPDADTETDIDDDRRQGPPPAAPSIM